MIEVHTNLNGASRPSGPCVTPWWWGRSCREFTESLTSKSVWFSGSRPRPDRSRFTPARQPSRRNHCGGSDPPEGSVYRAPPCAPVNARRCRSSGQKGGGAPSAFFPPVRRADAPGTREAQPRFALSQPTRGIRANPLPIRLSRQGPDHSSEGAPSEREALWLSKACAT